MTKVELLHYAAIAAGVEVTDTMRELWKYPRSSAWNPSDDDGDGARMEALIGIGVVWHSDGVVCGKKWASSTELFDDHGGDKQAARRMASLLVAAEIGKAMEC